MFMKIHQLLAILLLSNSVVAQIIMPADTRRQWDQLRVLSANSETLKPEQLESFPIYEINGQSFLSVMGKTVDHPEWASLRELGVIQGASVGRITTAKIPMSALSNVQLERVFSYVEIPSKVAPALDRVRYDVGVDSVYFGAGLPEGFDGENVLIGVTDWGFDYTHPMFYDTLLQQSRVVAAWDQFKNSGPHPSGYNYGTVYETPEELMLAGGDTANIYSFGTHGTHVAGITGGGGAGIQYRGMAPAAGFLFTTFLIDAASVVDGFHWMQQVAQAQGKRLVINMSWGLTYMGTLDGTSLLSQVIDQMSDEGVVFVASAGNNGDNDHHIKYTFNNSEFQTRINFDAQTPQPNNWGESVTMWGEPNQTFWSRLQVYNSLNALQAETAQFMTNNMPAYFDSMLVVGSDTVFFNVTTDASFPTNQRPHMRLRVRNQSNSLKIILNSGAESGIVHYWNVIELANGVGNWGLPFTSCGTTVVNGDSQYSIAEPTCASSCISVAAYSARYLSNFGNLLGGGIASFTSYGPLLNETHKPDIAAPGVNVCSSISSFTDYNYSAIDNVSFNGGEYDFARMSGTSMSSPCVAGIVALLLDANPFLTPAQVKEILMATARTDEFTGPISAPGDVRWGMGKVDAYEAVMLALATEGLNITNAASSEIDIYPNPAECVIFIRTSSDIQMKTVRFFGMNGQRFELPVVSGTIDVGSLAAGVYILQIESTGKIVRRRIVIMN
ncbi:MAG: S8 family peptidase [Flavobacteriales bacterium]